MSPLRLSLGSYVTRLHCIHGVTIQGVSRIRAHSHFHAFIHICISIFARIHTNCASWFPETQKSRDQKKNYGERRIKDPGLAKKREDVFHYANHVFMPFSK